MVPSTANGAPKRVDVFGFSVFSDDLSKIPLALPGATIATISPNSYGIATRDVEFRKALVEADYLVLDGVYFALSSILLQGRTIKPNQGPDVFAFFMKKMSDAGGRVFFLGSSPDTLGKIASRAEREFPRIVVETFSPPFKAEFSDEENRVMIDRINGFAPDVLFVGMTAPKQEKWAHRHRSQLNTKLTVSIGAVFDWFAGNEKPVAPIWWKLRLGWLVRTLQRPEILRRYPNIFIFFWHLLLARVGMKKFQQGR